MRFSLNVLNLDNECNNLLAMWGVKVLECLLIKPQYSISSDSLGF